jgi:hypothetical protein
MNKPFRGLPDSIPLRGGPADQRNVNNQGVPVIRFLIPEPFRVPRENYPEDLVRPPRFHEYKIHPAGFYEYQGYQ